MATQITVEVSRDSIDPQGIGSDEQFESCREYILDAVKTAFPGAEVTAVGHGGKTTAYTDAGQDLSYDVRGVVNRAFDDWCGLAH